jgi:hypothetical protein
MDGSSEGIAVDDVVDLQLIARGSGEISPQEREAVA